MLDIADALVISPDGCPRQQLRMNVTTIGPLIASYLAERPSELKQCNPCPGPLNERWCRTSNLFPMEKAFRCICNGRGYCIYSLDTRPSLTLRCQCFHDCRSYPPAEWKAQAYVRTYEAQAFAYEPQWFGYVRMSHKGLDMSQKGSAMRHTIKAHIVVAFIACTTFA